MNTLQLSRRKVDNNKSRWNYVRKFSQGNPVLSVSDLLISLACSSSRIEPQWFIIKGHRVPPGFILQMRLQTLIDLISRRELFYAIPSTVEEM